VGGTYVDMVNIDGLPENNSTNIYRKLSVINSLQAASVSGTF